MTGVEAEDCLGVLQLPRENVRLVGDARIICRPQRPVRAGRARSRKAGSKGCVEGVLEVVFEAIVADGAAKIVGPS